jgi:hypothetical protein
MRLALPFFHAIVGPKDLSEASELLCSSAMDALRAWCETERGCMPFSSAMGEMRLLLPCFQCN